MQWTDTTGSTEKWARVVTIFPITTDSRLGGAMNTKMSTQIYAATKAMDRLNNGPVQNTTFEAWNKFIEPPAIETFHGKQVSDSKLADYYSIRTEHGWREWGEGGKVEGQRELGRYDKPTGTRTLYQRDTVRSNPFAPADNELALLSTAGSSGSESSRNLSPEEESGIKDVFLKWQAKVRGHYYSFE